MVVASLLEEEDIIVTLDARPRQRRVAYSTLPHSFYHATNSSVTLSKEDALVCLKGLLCTKGKIKYGTKP